jgi:hypothetical protein
LPVQESGPKRFSVFHATRHGPLRYEAVLQWEVILSFFSDNENGLHLFYGFARNYKQLKFV